MPGRYQIHLWKQVNCADPLGDVQIGPGRMLDSESSPRHFPSPAGSWVSRESALLYSSEQNQVPQELAVSVPWQWKGWQPGRMCGSALTIIVESPEA